ncbi:DUF1634 domain-containing protein [Pedobacter duraquae]|uniref:Putative membrane protein n=1 Tax=Pedobacter duraquae TaxID=425511 RepID=A0A4R6IIH1_9SPHI|nr:DUF1634 domain-containing protein [Pedobacter duraquae]TDO21760.1 putative membrane protein [Pedobacter duraquae]
MKKEAKSVFVDKDIQFILGTLLRVGVVTAMTVVFVGGLIYLLVASNKIADYHVFKPELAEYSSISAILSGVLSFNGKAIIQFGTLLLIFTPITRVVFSVFSFLIERDYMYVTIGLFVLAVILFSLSNKLVG